MNSTPVPRIFSFHVVNLGNCCMRCPTSCIHVVIRKAIAPRQLLLGNCSSTTAPRQPLLRCPNKLHPCNDALSYYRPSMDICVALISYIHVTMHCPTTVHPWTYAHASYLCPVGTSLLLGATCTLNLDILDHNLPGPDLIRCSSLSPGSVP